MSLESLSPRERECLRSLLRQGSIKKVAAVLGISPRTVETHLGSARDKLGVADSWAAAQKLSDFEGRLDSPRGSVAVAAEPSITPSHGGEPDPWPVNEQTAKILSLWLLLFPPIGRPPNDLNAAERRMLMALQAFTAIGAAAAFFLLLYGVDLFFRDLATQGSFGFHSTHPQ